MTCLVTGGAGFIGSHLVDTLIANGEPVRVLDDLSTGHEANLHTAADFLLGDVTDEMVVKQAVDGVDTVFHIGALGSVARSIEDPLRTDAVNVHGTLTVLQAAREAGVRRVVFASSSSVYGGVAPRPTKEEHPVHPRSPYAASKIAAEHYCRVFSETLELDTVCLRYFNIYGPRQRSDSPYAAAIPRFIQALLEGREPVVHGDGMQTRDFTYVSDAVAANLLAARAPAEMVTGRVFNVAGGQPHSLLEVIEILGAHTGATPRPRHDPARVGDVRDSHADISAARGLGYEPAIDLAEGLRRTVESFRA